MIKSIRLSREVFSGWERGVGQLRPDLVYRTPESAECWLRLTLSHDYPYSFDELGLLGKACEQGQFDVLRACLSGVFIGPADSRKELCLLKSLEPCDGSSLKCLVVDSSEPLLDVALGRLKVQGVRAVDGLLIDVNEVSAARRAIDAALTPQLKPTVFTLFGNIVGNYRDLGVFASLASLMTPGDYAVVGVHLKQSNLTDQTYPAYGTPSYLAHMRSVLQAAGIDPNCGELSVRVCRSNDRTVDTVQILFSPKHDQNILIDDRGDDASLECLREIIVDESAKFDRHFLAEQAKAVGLQVRNLLPTNSRISMLLLLQKDSGSISRKFE